HQTHIEGRAVRVSTCRLSALADALEAHPYQPRGGFNRSGFIPIARKSQLSFTHAAGQVTVVTHRRRLVKAAENGPSNQSEQVQLIVSR
ncbi:MAG: hypothetical protein OER86_10945, partial [Phycisphaerae bacterium]|nr:hypothetical protein [Phycisphaerae bacterium]